MVRMKHTVIVGQADRPDDLRWPSIYLRLASTYGWLREGLTRQVPVHSIGQPARSICTLGDHGSTASTP